MFNTKKQKIVSISVLSLAVIVVFGIVYAAFTQDLNLNKSTYKGTINGDNKGKEVKLKLDSNSKVVLTGDSYVTSFEGDYSNIDFNGYTLYVDGKAIKG